MQPLQVPESQECPLCAEHAPFHVTTRWGSYFHCPECDLISQWKRQWLGLAAERAYYGTHENDPEDPAYRAFLRRLTEPLFERLPLGARGLDFGCGPAPAVSRMAVEAGFSMVNYDPLFLDETAVLDARYDFVTCTETAEHFHQPAREFARIAGLVTADGWIGLMTELHDTAGHFSDWWYHRDPTHVVFYSRVTLEWLARRFDWRIDYQDKAVTLFRRESSRG